MLQTMSLLPTVTVVPVLMFISNLHWLQEVKASSVVFLIAGYETLSNLLAYVAYELAVNQDCQRKLQEELDSVCKEEVSFNNLPILRLPVFICHLHRVCARVCARV